MFGSRDQLLVNSMDVEAKLLYFELVRVKVASLMGVNIGSVGAQGMCYSRSRCRNAYFVYDTCMNILPSHRVYMSLSTISHYLA